MNTNNAKEWTFGGIGLVVACFGAFNESWSLRGDLNHSYPFKIMSVPPPEYYVAVSNAIASFAPYIAALTGFVLFLFLRRRKVLAGIMPVVICPLMYIFGLRYLVSNSLYRDQLQNPINYDHSTAAMHHQAFNVGALNMLSFSIFVYFIFLTLIYGINYWVESGDPKTLSGRLS